jgi:hypothetical protein
MLTVMLERRAPDADVAEQPREDGEALAKLRTQASRWKKEKCIERGGDSSSDVDQKM